MPDIANLVDLTALSDERVTCILKDNTSVANIVIWISAVLEAEKRRLEKPQFHAWWNVQVPLKIKIRLLEAIERYWGADPALQQAKIFLESGCEQRLK